jgi:hypothetical protein
MTDSIKPTPPTFEKITNDTLRKLHDLADELDHDPVAEAADDYYEAYFCDRVQVLAEDGNFPETWADELGVTEWEMYQWTQTYPEFTRAFALALTKLRSKFTKELWKAARGKSFGAQSSLFVLLGKKRFADLYGDAKPPGIDDPPQRLPGTIDNMRDITPVETPDKDGELPNDPETLESLQKELEHLRKQQSY